MLKMEGLYKKIEIIRERSIPPPSPPHPTLDMQDWRASALNKLQVLVIHH